jgi:hypothetical protein
MTWVKRQVGTHLPFKQMVCPVQAVPAVPVVGSQFPDAPQNSLFVSGSMHRPLHMIWAAEQLSQQTAAMQRLPGGQISPANPASSPHPSVAPQ